MSFLKHRDEREVFEIDFVNRLAVAETLSSPSLKVARPIGERPRGHDGWTDVTTEFINAATYPTVIVTTRAQFTLVAAATAKQAAGSYDIYCSVQTSQGRILIGVVILDVTSEVTG